MNPRDAAVSHAEHSCQTPGCINQGKPRSQRRAAFTWESVDLDWYGRVEYKTLSPPFRAQPSARRRRPLFDGENSITTAANAIQTLSLAWCKKAVRPLSYGMSTIPRTLSTRGACDSRISSFQTSRGLVTETRSKAPLPARVYRLIPLFALSPWAKMLSSTVTITASRMVGSPGKLNSCSR